MSVQLIVFPQNYEGYSSVISTSTNEFIVDGINFNTVNAATDHAVTLPNGTQEAIDFFNPTLPINTWKIFYQGSIGVTNTPPNSLTIATSPGGQQQGILQKLSNLTIGAVYNINLDISSITSNTNSFGIWIYSGTILQSIIPIIGTSPLNQTYSFSASSVDDTIVIVGNSTIIEYLVINSISITNSSPVPTGAVQILGDGQVICDLYEDEDIPLSLSVDNFKNAAEKVQSYSKAFNLPATKRNNQIFDNMFEVTRSDDGIIFNPYVKTECVLKQDGFILFKGYLKMLDITDKEGEISYNVNLYSEVVALADILKDRTFSELDFSELSHDYNKTSIKNSWYEPASGTGLPLTSPLSTSSYAYDTTNQPAYGASQTNVLKYPFVDWNHQYTVVPPGTGNPVLPNLQSAFRPFIQLKYLINRIFEATPFTWESSFFDSADFEKLFMDFNWGADNTPIETEQTTFNPLYWYNNGTGGVANIATTSFTNMILNSTAGIWVAVPPPNYNTGTHIITSTVLNETYSINYSYRIENTDSSSQTVEFQWLYNSTPIDYSGVISIAAGATFNYAGNFTQAMTTIGDTLQVQFKASAGGVVRQKQDTSTATGGVTFNVGLSAVTNNTILQTLRGELGQWDFLKGILTMFNLVSIPDEDDPNNIKFEPYSDVFISDTAGLTLSDRSIQHDWTDRIDVTEMKLTPLTDLNKDTIFKFVEDDDDFCFMEYKRQVGGHLYGSKKFDASIASNGLATVLQGTKEIVAEPFAATISDTLMDQYPGLVVPKIYASSDDETEGFDNAPRILYNNGIKDSGITYYIPAQNGLGSENQEFFLQFSHLTDIPTIVTSPPAITNTNDFHFGECQLPNGLGASTPRNLFNLYWLPYYQELYNPNTRIMSIKVNLSPSIINTFKFNDTVMIKNREFRVNKIEYKPNDLATVEFILIP